MDASSPGPEEHSRRAQLGLLVVAVLAGGALVGLGALMGLNWLLRSEPFWSWPTPTKPGRPALIELVKVALTIVAGIGGLVALTVAYRRQVWLETDKAGHREEQKALHDRYGAAVAQLGHENPTVRLGGVYALANLANEWHTQRQQCVDVLCAYLRVPWDHHVDQQHPLARRTVEAEADNGKVTYAYPSSTGESEVRKTIVGVIAHHTRDTLTQPAGEGKPGPGIWSDLDFDFTGAVLPESTFNGCHFAGRTAWQQATFLAEAAFETATFSRNAEFGGAVFSSDAKFAGARFSGFAWFGEARFSGVAWFGGARFSGVAWFVYAEFSGVAEFGRAEFSDVAWFDAARFSGDARFGKAEFLSSARFAGARFLGDAEFDETSFLGDARFDEAKFLGDAGFGEARFSGYAWFWEVRFSGDARFGGAKFARPVDDEIHRWLTAEQIAHLGDDPGVENAAQ